MADFSQEANDVAVAAQAKGILELALQIQCNVLLIAQLVLDLKIMECMDPNDPPGPLGATAAATVSIDTTGEIRVNGRTKADIKQAIMEAEADTAVCKAKIELIEGRQTWLDRMLTEQSELDDRRDKLSAFFDTELFNSLSGEEQKRLEDQARHMRKYSQILNERRLAVLSPRQ